MVGGGAEETKNTELPTQQEIKSIVVINSYWNYRSLIFIYVEYLRLSPVPWIIHISTALSAATPDHESSS